MIENFPVDEKILQMRTQRSKDKAEGLQLVVGERLKEWKNCRLCSPSVSRK